MSSSKNIEFEKTSFLSKSNSAFIEQMYLKYINKDTDLPKSWQNYFEGIGEELDIVANEINGPSWGPSKKKIDIDEIKKKIDQEKSLIQKESKLVVDQKYSSRSNEDSIKLMIQFLTNEIRADGIKVNIYKKRCVSENNCTTSLLNSNLNNEIKLAILKKASLLKKKSIENRN